VLSVKLPTDVDTPVGRRLSLPYAYVTTSPDGYVIDVSSCVPALLYVKSMGTKFAALNDDSGPSCLTIEMA
jgi:hypothetical protein